MEASATLPKLSFLRTIYIFFTPIMLITLISLCNEAWAQEKVFADEVTFTSGNNKNTLIGCGLGGLLPCINQPTVLGQDNTLVDDGTFARLLASPGLAADLGSYDGILELRFPQTLPVDTWSFVHINGDTDLFGALLGGSLGEALGSVLGAVLVGNQEIIIDARLGDGAPILSRSSSDGFDTDRVKMLVDEAGNFHIAIRPNGDYDRIRITNTVGSLLGLGAEVVLDVYNAFYYPSDGAGCGRPSFTAFDGSGGLSLAVLEDENQYLERAIDNDPDTYSELKTGSLLSVDVAGNYAQHFYFPTTSAADHTFNIRLALATTGILNLDALGSLQIIAWDGDDPVYESSLVGGLLHGADLLTLLQDGNPATFTFAPGRAFDRVEVRQNSIVGASLLATAIRIYDIQRYDGVNCVNPEINAPIPTPPMLLQRDCDASVIDFAYTNFPYHAVDGNNDTYTTLQASSGIAAGIGAYEGFIELGFGQRTAGTTTYVRIDFEEEVLLGLLDGSVGQLLGTVVDNVLFGSHYFTVEAKQGGTQVLEASSNNGFGTAPVKIVQDKNGHYYIAVTPEDDYNSIRITESLGAMLGLGEIRSMNVYHACTSTGAASCEQAFATYSESSGISLDLLGIGGAGVQNAYLAIDDDDLSVEGDETYSEIAIGTAGIGAEIFQFVDFHTLSSPADYFKVKIGFENTSAVNLELLNNVVVRAYNGDELVYSQRLQNGLVAGLDILGLLSTENAVTIPIGPGRAFDRVAVGFEAVLDLGMAANPLRVYSIKRFGADCPDPNPLPNVPETESPFNGADCGIELGGFENVNFAYNAIDGDIDTYATLSAGSGVVLGLGGYAGYLELGYDQPVPALETSYIRIDMPDEGLLDALVGGSLGSILADVGELVLIGDHYFDLSVRRPDGTEIYETSSNGGLLTPTVRLVQDAVGRYYIAYTADEPYQSVRITLNNTALAGLDAVTTMNVYSMCRETVFDPCEQAAFTSFDGSGLSVALLEGANPAGVINPYYVIDDNNSNYAELTLGGIGVGVGATISQDIYFKTKVTTGANDLLRLRMQVPSSLADVSLLGNYRVYLYNGDEQVEDYTLANALLLYPDLLGLLNTGARVSIDIPVDPGTTYDRVRFEIASVAGVSVASPVRLYNIFRISDACPDPAYEAPPFDECADIIVDNNEYVDDIQHLIDGNHNSYATIRSDAGLITGINAYSGFVELGFAAVVPAGTPSYIRIGYEEDILNSLLAGSLGELVNGVLNGVALGHHYFNVTIQDADGNPITNGTGSSQNVFADADGQIRLVQDTKGRYYLEITPKVDYQSVRLEDHTTALLGVLSSEGHLDVYGLCHTPTTFECARAFSTSYEGGGLNADALGVGGAGVQNAFWAIDQNTSSASTLSLGALSVLNNSIQQHIQFDQVLSGNNNDQVLIRMQVGGGTVSAGILQEVSVMGLLNGVNVFTRNFEQAFTEANVYDVLNSATPVELVLDLEDGEAIDEIVIRLGNNIAGIGVAPNVSIYHVIPLCNSYVNSSLRVAKDGAIADGIDFNIVEAVIVNQDNDVITNADVEFAIAHVDGTATTETVTTDADGVATVQVTSTMMGVASVTATVGGMVITHGSPAEVFFVAGPVDYGNSQLEVTKDNAVADGVDYNEFTATVVDANNNPIASADVVFNITNPDGTTGTETVPTGADGTAAIQPISTTAGAVTVEALVDGTEINNSPATATFVAGPVDHGNSQLEVTKDNAAADGVDYNEFTATVVDAFVNPIAGADVVFTITNPEGSTSTETVTTDANGEAVLQVTSTTAGQVVVEALVDGTEINNSPATATFVAGPVDYDNSELAVTKDNAVADGVDYNEFTATVVDANNNPIASADVVFNITNPDGTTDTETVPTGADGTAVIQPTSTTAGEVTVEALVDGTEITNSPATATFVAGPVDHGNSNLTVTKDNAVADGVDYNEFTATIVDAHDNPIAGADVFFNITNPDGSTSTETVPTGADGTAVIQPTSTTTGNVTVEALVDGTEIDNSPATATFVAGPVDYGNSNLTVTKDNAVADGVDYNEFTATVVDAFSNAIAGADVVFNITNPDGSTSTETVTTGANGEAVLQVTSTTAGQIVVEASVDGTEIDNSPATATFVAGPVDHVNSNLEVTKDNAVADGVDYNEFTATIVDAFDNPIAGADVVFNITHPDGTTDTETVTTGADGTAVIQPTSTTAGEVTVEALVDGTEINNSPATATFVAGPVDHVNSNLAVTKDNAVADGVDYNEFTATIVDAFDNPIAGADVVFNITHPDGTTDTETVPTGADGTAVIQPTSTTAGEVTVEALVDGSEIDNSPATATFVAGPVDYGNSNLTVTKDNAVADGVDYNEFTATIVDAFDNPIAGADVVFNITHPDGTTDTETVPTGADGTAVIQPTSTTAGEVTVEALVDGSEIDNSPATATFVAGPVDYGNSNLTVTKDNAVADGVDYNEFTATVVDAFSNAIAGADVVFNITHPDGTTDTETVTTDAAGTAVIQPTSTTAGEVTVEALVDGTEISNSPATATFVAGPVDHGNSNLTVTKDNAVADGVDYNEFTATIVDAFDNPIAGADVVFNITHPDGTTDTETVPTGADGTAVIQPTSTTAGEVTVEALVDGSEIDNSPATATFVAGPVDYGNSNLTVTKDNAVADGVDYNEFTATVVDAFSNAIAGADVVFNITHPDGTTDTETVTTGAAGTAVIQPTSTTAGEVTVEALVDGTEISNSPATATFVAGPVDHGNSNLTVTKDNAVADGVDYNEFTATIVDAFDNPIAGADVVFNITHPDGSTSTETVPTGADGTAVIQPTSTTAGEVTVEALVDGTEIDNSPATATFVAGPVDHDNSNLTVTKDNAVADGVDYNEFTATIVDANNNPIAGADVVFNITNSDGSTSTETVPTGADGTAVIQPTSTTAGAVTVEALVDGTEINNSPATATFVAGPVDHGNSNLEVTKDNAVADGVDYNEFTATVVDAHGNPIAGADVVFTITNPDGTTDTETVPTGADGTAVIQLTSNTAGEVAVEALVDGTEITNSPATATFVAGPVDHVNSNLAVTKDNAVADGVDYNEFTATIVDAFSNPIAGADVVFNITHPDGTTGAETVTTDVNGQAVVETRSTTAGDITVEALVDGTEINNSPATATFVAGPVDHDNSQLEVTKDNAVADGVDYNEFTATIVDANNNPIANADVVFNITNPDATTGTQTVTTGADGTAVIQPTSSTAGEVTVEALVDGTEITNSPATATFVAGPVDHGNSNLEVTKDNAVADGVDYNEFTATIVDAFDNPIAGADVVFNITHPDGTTSTQTVTTGADGTAVIQPTSTTAGEVTVEALVDGTEINNSPATATFVAGPVDHDNSQLVVTKDNAVADGVDYNEFTATVVDANNNPIESADVVFNITNPDGTTATETVTTGADGTAVIQPTSTTAGDVTVEALVDGTEINNSPATATFIVANNISVTKTADDAFVTAGGETTFTITLTNEGPVQVEVGKTISLAERPGSGVTITGYDIDGDNATVSGTGNTATVTTEAVIPVGGTITVVVTADVDANAGETITNGITVWGPDKDPEGDPEDDRDDTPEIPVVRESNLSISKSANDASVVAGGSTSFTLVITNDGPSAIASGEAISLAERPGTGVTITGYDIDGDNATVSGTGNMATVTTAAVIPVGGTITVVVTADVDANAGETITNGITVWGPDKDPETDPEDDRDDTPDIPVTRDSHLAIDKVADQDRVQAGESTTFTLTITNNGPSVMATNESFTLVERPGEGLTITGYEVLSGPATVAGSGNTAIVSTNADLAIGATIVVRVTAAVSADAPETITNGVDVYGPGKNPDTDDPDDGDDTPEIPVDHEYDVSITKTADQDRVRAGESTTFTLTITNNGPATVASGRTFSLVERPGTGVTITGYEVTSDNASIQGNGNSATVTATQSLASGSTIAVKVSADVSAAARGTITNGISVWAPGKNPGDDEPDDEDDTAPIPVDREFGLTIDKVADDETVVMGGTTTFTVTVTNNGPATILAGETITVEERPADGLVVTGYESVTDNGQVSGDGNRAQLVATENIPAGGTVAFSVSADVTAPAGETVSNGIAVWGPGKVPGTHEEDDEAQTPEIPVVAPFTLSVTKEADQSLVTAGQPTTFTVTVTNNGPMAIGEGENIRLEERPGTGVTITNYEVLSGVAQISGNGNQATLTTTGSFDTGASIVIRISADVSVTAIGSITNGIAVWRPGNEGDPDDEDNSNPVPVDAVLHVPNLFTPNGDGINDQFVIRNLMQYQQRELTVLNRWGNQVFRTSNYNNDWDGGSLGEGTYFYILRVRNSSSEEWQAQKGAVALIRNTNR